MRPPRPSEHLHRPRLLEHHEDAVEHDGHEQDVDGVGDAEGAEATTYRSEGLGPPRIDAPAEPALEPSITRK